MILAKLDISGNCQRSRLDPRLISRFRNTLKSWENALLVYLLFTIILYLVAFPSKSDDECGREWGLAHSEVETVPVTIHHIMSGKPLELAQNDKRLLRYIWDNGILERPSTLSYNLTNPQENPSGGQEQLVQAILGNMTNGFFVEVGGYDGEIRSNSLWLELNLGWEGLLVEPDPDNYAVLKRKNRKAWTSQSCLSIHPYPHQADFMQHKSHPSMGKIVGPNEGITEKVVKVQCIPLFSFLSALNVTQVDYFSLDVEGLELEILKTVPFDKVLFKTLSVEFLDTEDKKGQDSLLQLMKSKGYRMVKEIRKKYGMANDFIFVHSSVNYVV